MLNRYRKIRRKLADDNEFLKYSRYAIGEITLIVLGVIIALQINNWNEERKIDQQFKLGLTELYYQLQVEIYGYATLKDRLEYQLSRIDSLMNGETFDNPHRIPPILQVIDDITLNQEYTDAGWKKSLFTFISTDTELNQTAKTARRYFANAENILAPYEELGLLNLMQEHLKQSHIPMRILEQGQGFDQYINSVPHGFFSPENIETVLALIRSNEFISDLKSISESKKQVLRNIEIIAQSGYGFLTTLKNQYPFLVDNSFERLELIGSGTKLKNWSIGLEMIPDPENEGIWSIETDLVDGLVKFRSDFDWTFDWGKGQFNANELIFKGSNIPVEAGRYLVRIDLVNGTYSFDLK